MNHDALANRVGYLLSQALMAFPADASERDASASFVHLGRRVEIRITDEALIDEPEPDDDSPADGFDDESEDE